MEFSIRTWNWKVKTVISVITEHKHCIYCLFTSYLLQKEDLSLFLFFFFHILHCSLITLTQVCNYETRSKLTAKTCKNIKRTKFCLLSRIPRLKKILFKKCHMCCRNSRSVHCFQQTHTCLLHGLAVLLFFCFGILCKNHYELHHHTFTWQHRMVSVDLRVNKPLSFLTSGIRSVLRVWGQGKSWGSKRRMRNLCFSKVNGVVALPLRISVFQGLVWIWCLCLPHFPPYYYF